VEHLVRDSVNTVRLTLPLPTGEVFARAPIQMWLSVPDVDVAGADDRAFHRAVTLPTVTSPLPTVAEEVVATPL